MIRMKNNGQSAAKLLWGNPGEGSTTRIYRLRLHGYDDEIRRTSNTVRSAQPQTDHAVGEDIVYSMIERHSGKASQPTTTRGSTTSSLILIAKTRSVKAAVFF